MLLLHSSDNTSLLIILYIVPWLYSLNLEYTGGHAWEVSIIDWSQILLVNRCLSDLATAPHDYPVAVDNLSDVVRPSFEANLKIAGGCARRTIDNRGELSQI